MLDNKIEKNYTQRLTELGMIPLCWNIFFINKTVQLYMYIENELTKPFEH
jgi:hypothetical protein